MSNSVTGPSQAAADQGYFVRSGPEATNRAKESNQVFMKCKIERYYNLGASLAKCLGLFDCVNFVQYLLNLLEEYEVYIILQNQRLSSMTSQDTARGPTGSQLSSSYGHNASGSGKAADNLIIQRFVLQPVCTPMEVKTRD